MSRIGKKPVPVPKGVTATVDGQKVVGQGAEGRARPSSPPTTSRSRWRTARIAVEPRDESKAARAGLGHVADDGREPGRGRDQGFRAQARDQRRRLPRRGAGQEPAAQARLQPRRRVSDPGGHHDRLRRSRPRSSSPASTSSRSARSRPRSASSAGRSPTRARASSTRARRSSARKARRSKGPWPCDQHPRPAHRTRPPRRFARPAHGRPRLSVFRSSKHIYAQVIDDAAGRTLAAASSLEKDLRDEAEDRRRQGGGGRGRQAARRARRQRPASRRSSSTAAATSITAASRRWPTAPARAASISDDGLNGRHHDNDIGQTEADSMARERETQPGPRAGGQRVRRQARPHQSRRQGGEGRPALRLRGARRRRRPEGPRRLRPRQGARGARGDPQGDRGRQARR